MPTLIKFSDAVTIALHCAGALAQAPERFFSARELADTFHVSLAHLALVMRRLARAGIVGSTRGPHGGFRLARPPTEVSLQDVYEAVDGPVEIRPCLFQNRLCSGDCCLFGNALVGLSRRLLQHLRETTLADVARCLNRAGPETTFVAREP